MNIYLIGFMGSGKTNIGKQLARQLGYKFYDLDEMFEDKYHFTVSHFFEKFGETEFRKIEKSLLLSTVNFTQAVISTGGGTPCFFDNMPFILKNGVSVYFKLTAPQLVSRLKQSRKPRPLVKSFEGEALEDQVAALLAIREPFYLQANRIIEGFDIKLEEVVNLLRDYLPASDS
ncbi:MAG: shikimate kinase [Bacteroidetes bacterium]|nr:shikimate kinase [Bacteroidota bacterium]